MHDFDKRFEKASRKFDRDFNRIRKWRGGGVKNIMSISGRAGSLYSNHLVVYTKHDGVFSINR